jgi:NitT/TauT family transport system permease protein
MIVGELAHRPAQVVGRRRSIHAFLQHRNVWRLLSLVVLVSAWQAFGTDYSTSFPSKIVVAAYHTFTSQVIPAFGDTLKGLGIGYLICVLVGVPLGLLMARVRVIELALEPYVNALYATPRLALIPVLILWLGITQPMRIAVVIVSGLFPIILNAYLGAREVNPNLVDAGTAFAANSRQIMRTVIFPGSLPYIFAGLRIGLGRAFIGIIVAEIETSTLGIGNLISVDATYLRMSDMWVAIISLGILSIIFSTTLKGAERWSTMPWLRGRRSGWLRRVLL